MGYLSSTLPHFIKMTSILSQEVTECWSIHGSFKVLGYIPLHACCKHKEWISDAKLSNCFQHLCPLRTF
jgi:hypothetical protein